MTVEQALLDLGSALKQLHYNFTAITPESHRRILERETDATTIRDVFGWNKAFAKEILPAAVFDKLQQTKAVIKKHDHYISQIRFASLYNDLYLHSGFPTLQQNAVFFGPDTYRYARLLHQHIDGARRVVDIGCGSGAGGLCLHDRVDQICLSDINPQALSYAAINAELAGVSKRVEILHSDVLGSVQGEVDLVISNPPYMVDDEE
ncbi:MAG: class I SAM-dependent methyltransferase, partial [Spongiibacteraceae bacterium]|nr:class I SAM-dependent methyltransferase [Spongiibacteraceae bacterium]